MRIAKHGAPLWAGAGLAILPCASADLDRGLVRLLPPERVIERNLWLVIHRDLSRTARVRAVVDFLGKLVHAQSDQGKAAKAKRKPVL